jgi:hypothetical protein
MRRQAASALGSWNPKPATRISGVQHGDPLAADHGPGRYRLRLHARDRRRLVMGDTTEEHFILAWLVEVASPQRPLLPTHSNGANSGFDGRALRTRRASLGPLKTVPNPIAVSIRATPTRPS